MNILFNKKVQLTKNPIVTDNLHLYQTIYTFIKLFTSLLKEIETSVPFPTSDFILTL